MDERSGSGSNVESRALSVGDGRFSVDTTLDVLSNSRRRETLEIVLTTQPVTVAGIARMLATREHDTDASHLREEVIAQFYLTLIHTHIPKLADAGLVRYNREQGSVHPTERTDRVKPLIGTAESQAKEH